MFNFSVIHHPVYFVITVIAAAILIFFILTLRRTFSKFFTFVRFSFAVFFYSSIFIFSTLIAFCYLFIFPYEIFFIGIAVNMEACCFLFLFDVLENLAVVRVVAIAARHRISSLFVNNFFYRRAGN